MPVLRTTIIEQGGPRTLLRIASGIFRDAAVEAGRLWFQTILPRHFTVEGGRAYGYQKRTAKYMRRKARKYGHQKPLVFSGNMQREIQSVERVDRTGKGSIVKLYGPRYFYAFRKDYGQADKAREVTTVTVAEETALGNFMARVSAQQMQANRERQVIVRGG